MSSVNFQSSMYNYPQAQSAVAFRGKAPNVSDSIKIVLDRRDYVRKHNGAIPADKIIRWFKELKLRISGPTTKELIEISTPQYNNKETKALMKFHEALAKKLLKK